MSFDPIPISPRAVHALIIVQSVLAGLSSVAAATALADIVGTRPAMALVIVVSAVQAGMGVYMGKVVAQTVTAVSDATGGAVQAANVAIGKARAAQQGTAQLAAEVHQTPTP